MSARHKARKRAVDVLYQADLRGGDITGIWQQHQQHSDTPVPEYTAAIVPGVAEHQARIDELISAYARDWSLERMPAVDRAIARVAVWELIASPEVSTAVILDEAIQLAHELSTDDSPGFLNGLLANIAPIARM